MPNLFIKTSHALAEEDRLTNALMAVLKLADRRVLSEFLLLAVGRPVPLDEDADVGLDLQVRYDDSRPDARIRTPSINVVIESKLGPILDEGQFRRHWKHLHRRQRKPTVLLGLTAATTEPGVVGEVSATGSDHLTARHLSWNQVLEMCFRLRSEFEADSGTHLLLAQLEAYLWHLGYYFVEGDLVEHLTNYGNALMAVAKHEGTTRNQLRSLLPRLAGLLEAHPGLEHLAFPIKVKGAGKTVTEKRVHFDFLSAEVPSLEGTRLRVLPSLPKGEDLRVHYYLTTDRRSETDAAVVAWIRTHRDDVVRDVRRGSVRRREVGGQVEGQPPQTRSDEDHGGPDRHPASRAEKTRSV